MHYVVPVEVKPSFNIIKERHKSSKQLAEYMRLSLKDQLDRCFIYGLILCGNMLRVLRCDREKMLATDQWLDIKKVLYAHLLIMFEADSPFSGL